MVIVLMNKEELLNLFDAYNAGEYSFAEVWLASGMSIRQLIAFMKENEIEVNFNIDFMEKDRGLNEDALARILEMNRNDEKN